MKNKIEKKMIEDSLRQECESSIKDRVKRYMQAKPHSIVAATHFASVSAESTLLYRDGHYYGCIALTQAVAEALVRFMCERNSFKPKKEFEKNLEKLETRGFITSEMKTSFLKIWENRDDYHHLNVQIKTNKHELERIALEKIRILTNIEKKVFDYTIENGIAIKQKNMKYWDVAGDYTQAFLKIMP